MEKEVNRKVRGLPCQSDTAQSIFGSSLPAIRTAFGGV